MLLGFGVDNFVSFLLLQFSSDSSKPQVSDSQCRSKEHSKNDHDDADGGELVLRTSACGRLRVCGEGYGVVFVVVDADEITQEGITEDEHALIVTDLRHRNNTVGTQICYSATINVACGRDCVFVAVEGDRQRLEGI